MKGKTLLSVGLETSARLSAAGDMKGALAEPVAQLLSAVQE